MTAKKKQVLISEVCDYGTNASLHVESDNPLTAPCEGFVKIQANPLDEKELSEEENQKKESR